MAKLCIVTSLSDTCFYRHYSVWANGKVYHFNEKGAHCENENDFMNNRRPIREMVANKSDEEVERYYQEHLDCTYNPILFNCEHFAYECATGHKKSPTVRGYCIGAIAVAFTIFMLYVTNK